MFLTSKFQIGSRKAGRVDYDLKEQVFHHNDMPSRAKAARAELEAVRREARMLHRRTWNSATKTGKVICGMKRNGWDADPAIDSAYKRRDAKHRSSHRLKRTIDNIIHLKETQYDPQALAGPWNCSTVVEKKPLGKAPRNRPPIRRPTLVQRTVQLNESLRDKKRSVRRQAAIARRLQEETGQAPRVELEMKRPGSVGRFGGLLTAPSSAASSASPQSGAQAELYESSMQLPAGTRHRVVGDHGPLAPAGARKAKSAFEKSGVLSRTKADTADTVAGLYTWDKLPSLLDRTMHLRSSSGDSSSRRPGVQAEGYQFHGQCNGVMPDGSKHHLRSSYKVQRWPFIPKTWSSIKRGDFNHSNAPVDPECECDCQDCGCRLAQRTSGRKTAAARLQAVRGQVVKYEHSGVFERDPGGAEGQPQQQQQQDDDEDSGGFHWSCCLSTDPTSRGCKQILVTRGSGHWNWTKV